MLPVEVIYQNTFLYTTIYYIVLHIYANLLEHNL